MTLAETGSAGKKFRLGIDLGGTKIEGIVLDPDGVEMFRKRIETEQQHGYRHILGRIKLLHDELLARLGGKSSTFGIGTPGAISPRTALMKNSNTVCLNGQPLKTDLEKLLGRKIEIQNDANCFATAEALFGAGRGKPSTRFGTLGEGFIGLDFSQVSAQCEAENKIETTFLVLEHKLL